jgi:Na+-transporting NADH:ubiquinone oxidoreductase subunit C
MKEKPWFAVVYIFCLTAVLSFIVIGFAELTKERVEANKRLALERAVLEVFALAEDKSAAQLHQTFLDRTRSVDDGEYYTLIENGTIIAFAVCVEGSGFWAPIKGVVGVSVDRKTITGISFYEQNETPGLGGEIAGLPFRSKFKNLLIASEGDPIGIKPFGADLAENEVHAISGATQTCTRLEAIINEDLSRWLGIERTEDGE